jgi:3-methyl-2-oxobutanoate hydroxymethyltransferase
MGAKIMKKKLTIKELLDLKGKRKIIMTTAFDYNTAKACELAGIDIIVTWSQNYDSLEELFIVLDQVRKGAPNTLIGAAIPKSISYISESEAMRCALFAMKNGADMIYSSGMELAKVSVLTRQGIPFVGHVGLLPVKATWFGGLRAVGKTWDEAVQVYQNTIDFQNAGAIAVEMECVPEKVAAEITKRANILTFSMGSGPNCDGQFIFSCDLLGTHDGHYPRHARKYCNFFDDSVRALKQYRQDIINGEFPSLINNIAINDDEYAKFIENLISKPKL